MKRLKLTYGFLLCTLFACELEQLYIEVEQAETRLVISSNITPGNPMLVTVTRSFSALEGNEDTLDTEFLDRILVANADVTVSTTDLVMTLEPIDGVPGVYLSQDNLSNNEDQITLDVVDPDTGLSISATTTVMPRVDISEVRFIEEIMDEDTLHSIVFEFTDPTTSNWYVINVFDPNQFLDDFSENPFGVVNGDDNGIIYDELISDETFEEPVYRDTIEFVDPIESDSVIFYFSNITEGHFRFLNSQQRTGGILSSATGEPINHPSNIEGGYGYFSAHNPSLSLAIKEDD